MAHTVISKRTTAISTPTQFTVSAARLPATLLATGLTPGEQIDVMFSVDGGSTWETFMVEGSALVLTSDANNFGINHPYVLGFTKGITAQLAGVFVSASDNI